MDKVGASHRSSFTYKERDCNSQNKYYPTIYICLDSKSGWAGDRGTWSDKQQEQRSAMWRGMNVGDCEQYLLWQKGQHPQTYMSHTCFLPHTKHSTFSCKKAAGVPRVAPPPRHPSTFQKGSEQQCYVGITLT